MIILFAYNFPHKRSIAFIKKLHELGYIFKVIAQDFKQLSHNPTYKPPKEGEHPMELCKKLKIEYIVRNHNKSEDLLEGYGIIAGARILSKEIVNKILIINFHPGMIPHVRGLNSFGKSLEKGVPLGVTIHIIDENIDAGEKLLWCRIDLKPGETEQQWKDRMLERSTELLPEAIEKLWAIKH